MRHDRSNAHEWPLVANATMPPYVRRRPLRVVAGVDWSADSLAGVRQLAGLYTADEMVLVHAVPTDELPLPACCEKESVRTPVSGHGPQQSAVPGARRNLCWVSTMIQKTVPETREICQVGEPAGVVLAAAQNVGAGLIVVGRQGARDGLDGTMGSVAHQVCLNAECSTLVVMKPCRPTRRVLALVQHADDVLALQRWLRQFPFKEAAELTVLWVTAGPRPEEPIGPLSARFWKDTAINNSRSLLNTLVRDLQGPSLRVTGRAIRGDAYRIIHEEGSGFDLLMLHGSDRKGRDPRRSGLPWRQLLRFAPCSSLVVRHLD
jgi:nucleotide-binding universal stress UspA family protein